MGGRGGGGYNMSGCEAAAVTARSAKKMLSCFSKRQERSRSISQLYSPKIFTADSFLFGIKTSTFLDPLFSDG